MIRQFVCLLLVPLMLANQGLCFAHAHHGTDVAEPEGHASRPHFHSGGHCHQTHDQEHHADHSHGDHSRRDHRSDEHNAALPPAFLPIGDHDADAVYCAEAIIFARKGNSVIVLVHSAKYVVASSILQATHQNDDWLLRLGPLHGQPASVFNAACPIYLRTLSLRL